MHVKTIRSQKLRMLLTHRKLLQSKAIAIALEVGVPQEIWDQCMAKIS